jgi:UDP-glucuronate 4-epimerase
MTRVVVTGAAGFVGMHVSRRLLERGDAVLGIDSLTPYYDVSLKERRLAIVRKHPHFGFEKVDLAEREAAREVFRAARASRVVHLAAQPGVRYSLENPHAYVDSNVTGFLNVSRRAGTTRCATSSTRARARSTAGTRSFRSRRRTPSSGH